MALINSPIFIASISILVFSYIIEILQYFHFINKIGLQHSSVARIVFGTTFEWAYIIAYTTGIIAVVVNELIIKKF